jgi:hypothetical protein
MPLPDEITKENTNLLAVLYYGQVWREDGDTYTDFLKKQNMTPSSSMFDLRMAGTVSCMFGDKTLSELADYEQSMEKKAFLDGFYLEFNNNYQGKVQKNLPYLLQGVGFLTGIIGIDVNKGSLCERIGSGFLNYVSNNREAYNKAYEQGKQVAGEIGSGRIKDLFKN